MYGKHKVTLSRKWLNIGYYLDQPLNNIHINNVFLYHKYCYKFRHICIIFRETYFLTAKVTELVRLRYRNLFLICMLCSGWSG